MASRPDTALQANEIAPKERVRWRNALTGTKSGPVKMTDKRNKRIIAKAILRFVDRSRAAAKVKVEAMAAAAAHKAAGTDRAGVIKTRKAKEQAEKTKRGEDRVASSRMKQMNDGTRVARAAECDPVRLALGKIDLSNPPIKAVLEEECKARGNNFPTAAAHGVKELTGWLSDYHKARSEDPRFVPQLTVDGKRAVVWRRQDAAASAAAPAASGALGSAMEAEDAPGSSF